MFWVRLLQQCCLQIRGLQEGKDSAGCVEFTSAEACGLNTEVLMPFSMFQTSTSSSDLLFSMKVAKETITLIIHIQECFTEIVNFI